MLDGVIIKASKAANNLYDREITGKPILDLVDSSERDKLISRIKQYINTNRGNIKKNLYLDHTCQFYFGVKSKIISWQGKKAIFSIAEKMDIPVQMPLSIFEYQNNGIDL